MYTVIFEDIIILYVFLQGGRFNVNLCIWSVIVWHLVYLVLFMLSVNARHHAISHCLSCFIKFPLIISTLFFQCPFIIADIATISCCVPHNKQVFYQLLVQQE